MNQDFDDSAEFDPDMIDWDEYYSDEGWEKPLQEVHQVDEAQPDTNKLGTPFDFHTAQHVPTQPLTGAYSFYLFYH